MGSGTTNNVFTKSPNSSSIHPSKPPVGGYGKPNLAPKPPTSKESSLSQLSNTTDCSGSNIGLNELEKPSPPPKKIVLNGRAGVNRAQSMRVPKSPPVAPTTSPPFPPNYNKPNLVKNRLNLHQSQDSLNDKNYMSSKIGTLPHNFQKLSFFPPNIPPPPAPSQRKFKLLFFLSGNVNLIAFDRVVSN